MFALFRCTRDARMKYLSTLSRLTINFFGSNFGVIQINRPVVAQKRALPTEARKGIITFTLVVSRLQVSQDSTVKRGVFVFMFNFFKVKTKLEIQVEEYLEWKAKFSEYSAQAQKVVLYKFIGSLKLKEVGEIRLQDIQAFYDAIFQQETEYNRTNHMKAIRGFISYYYGRKLTTIRAREITDYGTDELKPVVKNVIIPTMTKRKPGRPMNVALVKKVKRLRDNEKLPFRAIGFAVKKDLKSTYRLYKYDLSKQSLAK